MHIVLSGYYGFDNVGDEAILYSIIQALRKIDPAVKITVLSNNPASTAETYKVSAVNRWKLAEINTVLKNCDGFISGGGSLMQDSTGLKTIPYYSGLIRMAKFHKKPVFVYAQGMGPINAGISKILVRSTFNKVDGITVRDIESLELLESIGVRPGHGKDTLVEKLKKSRFARTGDSDVAEASSTEAKLDTITVASQLEGNNTAAIVPDPVIGINAQHFRCSWLDSEMLDGRLSSKDFISVSVRDWPSSFDFKSSIAAGLDKLAAAGYSIVFVPMHGEHDDILSHEVADLMSEKSIIAPFNVPIEEKIAIIGASKLLIGMRLHSLIFASIAYTPFISISYDPKIDSFAAIAEQPVVGHVEAGGWSGDDLAQLSLEIIADNDRYNHIIESLRERINVLKSQAELTAQMAWAVFEK